MDGATTKSTETSEEIAFIEVYGISPEALADDYEAIAADVHRLLHEEYGVATTGVATVVNPERHAELSSAGEETN